MNKLSLIMLWNGKIPASCEVALKKKLEKISEDNLEAMQLLGLKNPTVGLVLCIFLGVFGADEFYRGRNVLGAIKLIFSAIMLFISVFGYVLIDELDYPIFARDVAIWAIFVAIWAILAIIWVGINLIQVSESIKRENLANIEKHLAML